MIALLPALAAAFVPSRAAALGRDGDPALAAEAARLAALPRADRLAALEEALLAQPRPSRALREQAVLRERPPLVARVRADEEWLALAPLLRRLVLELGWDPATVAPDSPSPPPAGRPPPARE